MSTKRKNAAPGRRGPANKRRKVTARLVRKGRRWLKQAKTWRAKVKITVRRRSVPPAKKTIRVKLKAPR